MAVRGEKVQHNIRPEHFVADGEALGLSLEQIRGWLGYMAEQLPQQARSTRDQMPYESPVIDLIVDEIARCTTRLLGQLRGPAG